MPKVRVRDNRPRQGNRKQLLWNRLMTLNILIYKMEEYNRNFIIITSDENVEKLISTKTRESLLKDEFEVYTPYEHNANRTAVLRNIDSLITSVDKELKSDIERRNEWATIVDIIKIPTAPKILKIKFETVEMVRRATEKGMLVYNQSIPPQFIQKEIYVHLDMCYICYSYQQKTNTCRLLRYYL